VVLSVVSCLSRICHAPHHQHPPVGQGGGPGIPPPRRHLRAPHVVLPVGVGSEPLDVVCVPAENEDLAPCGGGLACSTGRRGGQGSEYVAGCFVLGRGGPQRSQLTARPSPLLALRLARPAQPHTTSALAHIRRRHSCSRGSRTHPAAAPLSLFPGCKQRTHTPAAPDSWPAMGGVWGWG